MDGGMMAGALPTRSELFDRELVLASAGSGKTYRLSSRLVGLLAGRAKPKEILASTFTRKAAGEIMDRVLLRLAAASKDQEAAAELAGSIPAGLPAGNLTTAACSSLLSDAAANLHRLQVLTIDALFYRIARAFPLRLGFPQRWRLADEPDRDRLRARAVEATLREMDPGVLVELARSAGRGVADRAVHRLLLDGVRDLYEIFRYIDPGAPDPWGMPAREDRATAPDPGRLEPLIRRLEEAQLPRTRSGRTHRSWERARQQAIRDLRESNWSRFLSIGLAGAILAHDGLYHGEPVPEEARGTLLDLIELAKRGFRSDHNRRLKAFGRFLPEYDRRFRRIAYDEALYHFEDLTHAISMLDRSADPAEIAYRLDQRIRHVLLDEFQDTSSAQWAALEPLLKSVLSGKEPGRALFVVADPKQSIYGWRGGEPRLVDRLRRKYGLEPELVSESYRSSSVVLGAVNRVFGEIRDNEALSTERASVERWAEGFQQHRAALDRPGYVRLEAGARESPGGRRAFRPALLGYAAERVATLHREAPGASIGVLTRTNQSAAYLFALLRRAGLDVSEEGGVPVADSVPVLQLLAVLRLTDHPADTISRYLVSRTPVATLFGVSEEDWENEPLVHRARMAVRRRLMSEGYGRVVSEWVRALSPAAADRDRRRLRQLAELAFRWDERRTARPTDFVRAAEAARMEDPASARVRVMTIHKAKGLEFDAVVLPDLNGRSMAGGRSSPYMACRAEGSGPVLRVLPRIRHELVPAFPELAEAAAQERESEVRDNLSTLYVALTRAHHALYLYVSPDSRRGSTTMSPARVLREALAPGRSAGPGDVLFADGTPDWWKEASAPPQPVPVHATHRKAPPQLRLASSPRRRMVPHRFPSALEGAGAAELERLLRPESREAMDRGSVVHAWLGAIEWIEDGLPSKSDLLSLASGTRLDALSLARLLERLRGWLRAEPIRRLLSRVSFPSGTRVERELAFLARDRDGILEGRADRVLYVPEDGGLRLVVIDWKSDAVDPGDASAVEAAVKRYRPQVEAYMRALAATEGLPEHRVEGRLAFVSAGLTRRISPGS